MNHYTTTTVLENGLRVVFVTNKDPRRLINISLSIPVGSRLEKKEERGYAHLVEHMLFAGTNKRTASQIEMELSNLGCNFNAYTYYNHTTIYAECLSTKAENVLEIISDMYFNSRFPLEYLNNEKKIVEEEILSRECDLSNYKRELTMSTHFGKNTQCGRRIVGNAETVRDATRTELLDFYTRNYSPKGAVLVVCGSMPDIHPDGKGGFLEEVRKHFNKEGRFGNKKRTSYRKPKGKLATTIDEIEQPITTIALGFDYCSNPSQKDIIEGSLLGDYITDLLYKEVRVKKGLTYYSGSFLFDQHDIATIFVEFDCSPENAKKTLDLVIKQVHKAYEKPPPNTSFNRVRDKYLTKSISSFENMGSLSMMYGEAFVYNPKTIDASEFVSIVADTNSKDTWKSVRKNLKGTPISITVCGTVEPELSHELLVGNKLKRRFK